MRNVKTILQDGCGEVAVGLIILIAMASNEQYYISMFVLAVAAIFFGARDISIAKDMDDGTYFG